MRKFSLNKRFILLLMVSLFLLAACSGEEQIQTSEAEQPAVESQPTAAEPTEVEPTKVLPTEVEPTEALAEEKGGAVSASGVQMECTLVSDQPDVPAEFAAIFGVKENDWVVGPDTAAVTFVEYGDFQ